MKSENEKIQETLNKADQECESANYHSQVGLAEKIYSETSNLVSVENRHALAKSIAKAIIDSI